MLIVVCGLPGVGKTSVARRITDRTGGTLLRTDVVRKELHPDPSYTADETESVYDELFDRARALAADGPVVLDGTFREARHRSRAKRAAEAVGSEFRLVKVECEEAVVRERIAARTGDESDADFEIHRRLREQFDPVGVDHAVVDNSASRDRTMARVDRLFDRAEP